MKFSLRIASLMIVFGLFGVSAELFAQKKTTNNAQAPAAKGTGQKKAFKSPKNPDFETRRDSNDRPPSTGTGNESNRPASTGENLSEMERLERAYKEIFRNTSRPGGVQEDSQENLSRTYGYINAAFGAVFTLKQKYEREHNTEDYSTDYEPQRSENMKDVKNNLNRALRYLNLVEYESNGNRAKAIDELNRAIRQIDTYLQNPPPPKFDNPPKQPRNGAEPANPRNRNNRSSTNNTTAPKASGVKKTNGANKTPKAQ